MSGFRWAPVPGADRYELRLRRRSSGQVLEHARPLVRNSRRVQPVEPGNYGLSLRSVDARGLENS